MPLVFWEGAPFDTPHEVEAQTRLARDLAARFADQPAEVHVAFSFHLPGAQVDVAALGPGGVVVGEMKEWPGVVRGALNGPWTVALPDGSAFIVGQKENPHAQCRRIRSVFAQYLTEWARGRRRSGGGAREWSARIRAGVVQCPRAAADLSTDLREPWWYIEGPSEWPERVGRLADGGDGLAGAEAASLLARLGLRRLPSAPRPAPAGPGPASLREEEQRDAITAPADRHLLVLAGPGAGKTRVLTGRVRHLVESGVPPGEIALLTYTNSARAEMQSRLLPAFERPGTAAGGAVPALPRMGTIHHFCLRLLREHAAVAGVRARIRILDNVAAERAFAAHVPPGGVSTGYREITRTLNHWAGDDDPPMAADVAAVWRSFEQTLRRRGVGTFEIVQTWALDLLRRRPEAAPRYVLVDEFQDTTGLQMRLLRALAAAGARVTVVGDSEQSIFSFAGADVAQMRTFADQFPGAETRRLRCNSRSQAAVVALASALRQAGDPLVPQTALRPAGERPVLLKVRDEHQQAAVVCDQVRRLVDGGGVSPGQVAVLVREGQPTALLEALDGAEMPWFAPADQRFESQPHIQRILATLEALQGPGEEYVEFSLFDRVAEGGPTAWKQMEFGFASTSDWDRAAEMALGALDEARRPEVERYLECRRILAEIRAEPDPEKRLRLAFGRLIEPRFTLPERRHRERILGEVDTLARLSAQYEDPFALASALRAGEVASAEQPDAITVGTLHFAKGREWPIVFILDLTEGVLPHRKSVYTEEERRMLHVGASRARDRLYLLAPERLVNRGRGFSRFLSPVETAMEVRDLR